LAYSLAKIKTVLLHVSEYTGVLDWFLDFITHDYTVQISITHTHLLSLL
jgi:hypothetical protein